MEKPKVENKLGLEPGSEPVPVVEKKVKIKFRLGRAGAGVGEPGQVVTVSEQVAIQYVRMGYADIIEEE